MRLGVTWDSSLDDRMALSSVVAAELFTGFIFRRNEVLGFDAFVKFMEGKNRIITPSHSNWLLSGILIGKIISKRPDLRSKKSLLFNDCLIATSSRQINAKVITANLKDFELIRSYLNFEVSYITC